MNSRPLGIVKEILDSLGIGLSYTYDDLIFVEHNAFLLQFTDKNDNLLVHINKEAAEDEVLKQISLMNNAAASRNMAFIMGRYYTLAQADEDNIRLEFSDTRE